MKRDPRLRGLSSEHHHALVLARRVRAQATSWTAADDGADLADRFARELAPHFALEESVLLTALHASGDAALIALATRTEEDHAFLRQSIAAARGAASEAILLAFADRLEAHVRFEERELFPACEAYLAASVLDEVARRAPGP